MIAGHNLAYEKIKEKNPKKQVGIVKHTVAFSSNKNPLNMLRAWFSNFFWTRIFMKGVYKKTDWIGLNYYHRKIYGDKRILKKTDMGWSIDPYGIYDALRILWKYKKPIYVAEAGCADEKDAFRKEYIDGTIKGIADAIKSGVDVRGYCYWSLLDNYEWAEGFSKRFGLVEIDYDTLERKVRSSAYFYKEICKSNSI
jgi:beta-glucosidase/6-phospho-beta-glucosidase/beta-galactosidase